MKWGYCIVLALGALVCAPGALLGQDAAGPEEPELGYQLNLSVGQLSGEGFREWWQEPDSLEDHYMFAGSLIRELARVGRVFVLEAEAGAAHHWGEFRGDGQEYQEAFASGNLRWKDMPWDRVVDTSLGFGLGASLTTEVPEHEERLHGRSREGLVYMMVDVTAAHPDSPGKMLFFRVHHRSGAWGLIDSVAGASNYLTGGLRLALD